MAVFKTENHQGLNSKANSQIQQRNMEGKVPFSLLLNSHIQLLMRVPTAAPFIPSREVRLAFPHVKWKGRICEIPVSLKEENAKLPILHSRIFHLQVRAILSLWKNNLFPEGDRCPDYLQGPEFLTYQEISPTPPPTASPSKPRGSSSPCRISVSQTQLARGRAAWQNSLFSCKIQKESLNSFCQSAVNST